MGRSEYLFHYCITAGTVNNFDAMTRLHTVVVEKRELELDMVKTRFHFTPVMNP